MFELAPEIAMPGTPEFTAFFHWLRDLAIASGVTLTMGTLGSFAPQLLGMMDGIEEGGSRFVGQGHSRGVNTVSSFRTTTAFDNLPVWREFRQLPIEAQRLGSGERAASADELAPRCFELGGPEAGAVGVEHLDEPGLGFGGRTRPASQ